MTEITERTTRRITLPEGLALEHGGAWLSVEHDEDEALELE